MENTLAKTQQQNRDRQKRFYDANKERINRVKQTIRDAQIKQPVIKPDTKPILKPDEPDKPIIYSEERVNDLINSLEMNENTRKKKLANIKIIFTAYPNHNLKNAINNYDTMKEQIENVRTTKNPDAIYSLESIKSIFETILWVVTVLNIPVKQAMFHKYELLVGIYKQKSIEKHKVVQNDPENAVFSYTEYMNKIETLYGNDSKAYLIASLYKEVHCRDDLGMLNLITRKNQIEPKKNYLLLKKKGNATITLQEYKTSSKYLTLNTLLSPELTDLIRKYVFKHNLTNRLFPESSLSKCISNMNKSVGMKQGVNGLRKALVTDFLKQPNLTLEERADFADKLAHTLQTQPYYCYIQK